ncbi:MAG: trypsin-like peptidase domain-containing protein [Pyrinomonadaceae bacterium]
MALLTQDEILQVIDALINSGVDTSANRGALLQFISNQFIAGLPIGGLPAAQLLSDIGRMNKVERLANGDVPLQIYLRNAALLLSAAEEEQKVIRTALDQIVHRASGSPRLDPANIPETKEKLIFRDDTVTFAFMDAGVKAASAVMKLRVPRFEAGQARKLAGGAQMMYLGTGWLLTESLVMTNHHVINARNEGEAAASAADFQLQAQGTLAQLDFDGDGQAGTELLIQALEASDATLDFAVLRIPATGRTPLRRAAKAIQMANDPVPVNIIQHPGGRSKRYGIRNNLVSAATATELRYFTDTEGGSSGSPVLNDQWEVVALHRASTYVSNVQFQGKTTAYVNLGTHLPAIIQDLQARFPALAAEIAV